MKPNLFDYAGRELSQDAFLAWLLNYANPTRRDSSYTYDDLRITECASRLIREMLFTHDITIDSKITKVVAGCRTEGNDIWTEVEVADGRKYLIIVEHYSERTSREPMLKNYRHQAREYCKANNFTALACIYLKSGSEAPNTVESVRSLGYAAMTIKSLVLHLSEFSDIRNDIFNDFYNSVSHLEAALMKFEPELSEAE